MATQKGETTRRIADVIGFDPIVWLDRLMDVNEASQFTPEQRATIAAGLMKTREELLRKAKL